MVEKYFGTKIKNVNYKYREGVYALISNGNNDLAIVKTPRGYFLPGGGIENNEDHIEALSREIQEELGFEIKIGELMGIYGEHLLGKSEQVYYEVVGNCYECQLGNFMDNKTELDHELVWLNYKEAAKALILEYQSYAVLKYGSIISNDSVGN